MIEKLIRLRLSGTSFWEYRLYDKKDMTHTCPHPAKNYFPSSPCRISTPEHRFSFFKRPALFRQHHAR